MIRERLDRALANDGWQRKFVNATVHHLNYSKSDHRPILMSLDEEPVHEHNGPTLLRLESRWLKEKRFLEVVQQAWDRSHAPAGNVSLADRLAAIHKDLHVWDRSVLKVQRINFAV